MEKKINNKKIYYDAQKLISQLGENPIVSNLVLFAAVEMNTIFISLYCSKIQQKKMIKFISDLDECKNEFIKIIKEK